MSVKVNINGENKVLNLEQLFQNPSVKKYLNIEEKQDVTSSFESSLVTETYNNLLFASKDRNVFAYKIPLKKYHLKYESSYFKNIKAYKKSLVSMEGSQVWNGTSTSDSRFLYRLVESANSGVLGAKEVCKYFHKEYSNILQNNALPVILDDIVIIYSSGNVYLITYKEFMKKTILLGGDVFNTVAKVTAQNYKRTILNNIHDSGEICWGNSKELSKTLHKHLENYSNSRKNHSDMVLLANKATNLFFNSYFNSDISRSNLAHLGLKDFCVKALKEVDFTKHLTENETIKAEKFVLDNAEDLFIRCNYKEESVLYEMTVPLILEIPISKLQK